MILRSLICAMLAALLFAPALASADGPTVLKIATLAPRGSSWMKLMVSWKKAVQKRTEGRVKIKFFPGGVQGDERDVVRKIRAGQLHGAAVTAVGMGLIQPEVRVLELPFLVRTDKELDHVRSTLAPELEERFRTKGFELMAWGDVGWVHLFSNIPIKSKADLKKLKMWAWVDDPIVRNLFERLKVNGVPLGVPDVLPSLQTGLIDACYGSALSTLVLQWHTKVKYMTKMPISMAIGASVLSKRAFESLSPEDQKILKEEAKGLEVKLIKKVRSDNRRALKKMKQLGIEVVDSPAAMRKEFEAEAKKVWAGLSGKLYPAELLAKVKKLAAAKR